ncbi:MAG: V-type ATP synthase subunit D [Clostridia bacterium]|nr:V-type ATP synthase subunit D [Clostridia bacterium]MBQ9781486.1 V-type ATP synthase subunit D [Clostridia bacterium]
MAELRVNPTRMELKKVQARYVTARRGHKLLKDKRDELMKRFLEVVREDKELRIRVEAALGAVHNSFSIASAVSSPQMLKEAMLLSKREGRLDVSYKNLMSVTVPVYSLEVTGEGGSDSYNYGMAFTSGELDASLRELNGILTDLVRMAELEKTAQMLAEEIEKTRRRVNALEYIMMPRYLETIKTIKMKLEENERGNTTRLMKVKDMMLAAQLKTQNTEEDE